MMEEAPMQVPTQEPEPLQPVQAPVDAPEPGPSKPSNHTMADKRLKEQTDRVKNQLLDEIR